MTAATTGCDRRAAGTAQASPGRSARHATALACGLGLGLVLSGCSLSGPFFDDSYDKSQLLSPEPVPAYRKLIAGAMKSLKTPIDPVGLAISEPRWIERIGGPAWIVCLKSDPKALHAVYYAFFIQKEAVVDTRTAIGTDRCVHQEFSPFDLAGQH
ncbi:hypothetical protein PQJ75_28805 [Rhodoplanes sp. TEM]|uniref:Lipoprotein n=1 Tax=Rhodoplanes tepidamans TaxID=200616 RepID=A0ABT5JIP8_RHOTP|nr:MULTISPECIES: hypothetical protein [Rhodoplanes]MDC7789600.1 hypothetical protein [Rhodoplanes tepidamans]MDC7987753.1 hypothetical protein [Rhodoplanes sp. TEM]MDQ0354015.1 hypothetical protein [Rhodoplanes tepidamans]